MGKTIALKLSEKENQIVTQLNQQGMNNSDLLRNALRQYFEFLQESMSQEHQEKSILHREEQVNTMVHESLQELKQELHDLREQTKETKVQVESDISKLQSQLYQLTVINPGQKQVLPAMKVKVVPEIHQEVDEFLKKRSQQMNFKR